MHHAEACISRAPVEHSPGLALPPSRETDIESLQYPDRKMGSFQYSGLPAPVFSQPLPSSLQSTISDVAYDLAPPVSDSLHLHGPSTPSPEFRLNPSGDSPESQAAFFTAGLEFDKGSHFIFLSSSVESLDKFFRSDASFF